METRISRKFAALAALGLLSAACGGNQTPPEGPQAAGDPAAEKASCKGEHGCHAEGKEHSCKGEQGCQAEGKEHSCKGEHGCQAEGKEHSCKGENGCEGATPAPSSSAPN